MFLRLFSHQKQIDERTLPKPNRIVFHRQVCAGQRSMGNCGIIIAIRAHDRQAGCQVYRQHSRQWTGWQRTATPFGRVSGNQLFNRSVYSLAAGQYTHPHFAIVESRRLFSCKRGHLRWWTRKVIEPRQTNQFIIPTNFLFIYSKYESLLISTLQIQFAWLRFESKLSRLL